MSAERNALLVARHLRVGWVMFFLFLAGGAALEALHGWKVAGYVGPAAETRRLLWTLAHAHGTLFGLAHVAFAATVRILPDARWSHFESLAFVGGSLLVPAGFFLGGTFLYDGDPGVGVVLVPLGVLFIIIGCAVIALRVLATRPGNPA